MQGSWNVKQGLPLSPVHEGNALVWCGQVSVPAVFTCEYSYHVVDDHKNVLRWESGEKKKLVVPEGVKDGDVVEVRDWWQVLIFKLPCVHSTVFLLVTVYLHAVQTIVALAATMRLINLAECYVSFVGMLLLL